MERLNVLCVLLVIAVPHCVCKGTDDDKIDLDYDPLESPFFKSKADHNTVFIYMKIRNSDDMAINVNLTVTSLNVTLLSTDPLEELVTFTKPTEGYLYSGKITLTVSKLVDGVTGDLMAKIECMSEECIKRSTQIIVYKETKKIRVDVLDVSPSVINNTATVTVSLTKEVSTASAFNVTVILTGDSDGKKHTGVVTLDGPSDRVQPSTVELKDLPLDDYRLSFGCLDEPCRSLKPLLILPPWPSKIEAQPGVYDLLKTLYDNLKSDKDQINKLQEQLADYNITKNNLKNLERIVCDNVHVFSVTLNLSSTCTDVGSGQTATESPSTAQPTSPDCNCSQIDPNMICVKPNMTCGCDDGFARNSSKCVPIICKEHLQIDNGKITPKKSSYNFGIVATYSCDNGFKLDGNKARTCEQNGTSTSGKFNGTAPTCEPICGKLSINNGKVSYSPDSQGPPYKPETVATYSCDNGFKLDGNKTRTCEQSGTSTSGKFSGTPPTCEPICGKLSINNGKVSYSPDSQGPPYKPETVATYSCDNGFELTGEKTRACGSNGFNGTDPKCSALTTTEASTSTNHYMEIGVAGLIVVLIVGLVGYVLYHYRAQVKQWAFAKKAAVSNLPRSLPQRLRRGGRYSKLPRTMQEALHQD